MKTKLDIHQEKLGPSIHSIWSMLEETIKHQKKNVLSCVDQKMQVLHKEVTKKTHETHIHIQTVKPSLHTWTTTSRNSTSDTRCHLYGVAIDMVSVGSQIY
jgi:hypothetical protein